MQRYRQERSKKNRGKLQWLAALLSFFFFSFFKFYFIFKLYITAFYNTKQKVRWCKQCFIQIPLERDWLVELKLEDTGEREGLQVVITEILAPGELKQRRGVECSWIHVCSTIHLTSSCVNLGTFVNLQWQIFIHWMRTGMLSMP